MQAILVAAIAVVGVDVGWQPTENGETEYIIQIEPHQLMTLKPGDKIDVGVRPHLRNISSFQIVVGDTQLPRIQAAPKLSLSSPDDQPIDTAAGVKPLVAKRYPNMPVFDDNSSRDNSSRSVVRPRADNDTPVTDTRWNGRNPERTWPTQPVAGNVQPSTRNRPGPITERRTAPVVDGNSPQPRLQRLDNVEATTEPRAAESDLRRPADDAQCRLIDIGGSVIPREPPRATDRALQPDSRLPLSDLSRQAGRDRSEPTRTISAPDFTAPGGGLTTADNPAAQPAKEVIGPRYAAQPEPTLPRFPADTSNPPRDASIVLPQTVAPDTSQSLEQVRREMARSLENRANARPLASDTGPAAFQIQPGEARYPASKTPRVAAATVTIPSAQAASPATSAASPTISTEKKTQAEPTEANPAIGISRPWLPLTLSLLALFASLGGNLYLGWMTLDLRRRFRHFARGLRFHEDDRRATSLASSALRDYD